MYFILKTKLNSIWITIDDAYLLGQIYTLLSSYVWFIAGKGFLSIDKKKNLVQTFVLKLTYWI